VAVFRAVQVPAKAEIRVRYTSPSGAVGEDSITLVASERASVLSWPDGNRVTTAPPTTPGVESMLRNPLMCTAAIGTWVAAAVAGVEIPFLNPYRVANSDVPFVNTFLLRRGYGDDPAPPSSISPSQFLLARANYRGGQDFQAGFEVDAGKIVEPVFAFTALTLGGSTPEPCTGLRLYVPLPNSVSAPEASSLNGSVWIDGARNSVSQVVNVRVGRAGQAADTYLNDRLSCSAFLCRFGTIGATTPWIWSTIKLNAEGTFQRSALVPGDSGLRSIFPSLTTYRQGVSQGEIGQGSALTFVGFDQSYTYQPEGGSRRITVLR
jgi:hypothetical protein